MTWPVVRTASGGLPVTEASNGFGVPYADATNGYGVPVTFVASGGLPVTHTFPFWSPLNEATLIAWWDAQNGLTLNATKVAVWTDRKSGIVAANTTDADRPVYSATARNGKPGLVFDGVASVLSGSSALLGIGQPANTIVLAGQTLTSATGPFVGWCSGAGGNIRALGTLAATAWAGDGAANIFGGPWVAGEDRLLEWTIPAGSGVSMSVFKDGVAGDPVVATPTSLDATTFKIGQYQPAVAWQWQGVIQQILIFGSAVPQSLRQKIEGWESWYDGKAGANLPGGHPYKLRAPTLADL